MNLPPIARLSPHDLPPIAQLLPHAGNVILLDSVKAFDADSLSAGATIRPNVFSDDRGGLAAWMGLEIMAQAVAAWAGCHAYQAGEPSKIGVLVGTRRYTCTVAHFAPGMLLEVRVARSLYDASGMAVFECVIDSNGRELASARLNVYSPPDAAAYLQEEN
jgi:predicted hotdog family 3-hydroxylacyl-ACP dehydratase